MRFVQFFFWGGDHKCLIYPTLSKIRTFLKQPNSLEQPNKQISKKKIFPFSPVLT